MESFDLPENTVSCARRDISIVPSQALALLNADWVSHSASQLAQRVERIDELFEAILGRKVTEQERGMCEAYLKDGRSIRELALVLVNSNELAFIP
jgi:hypothetical protein